MLGARNAVRKASRFRLAPKSDAITISRTSPRMRLQRIATPTTPVARALTRLFSGPAMARKNERGQGKCKAKTALPPLVEEVDDAPYGLATACRCLRRQLAKCAINATSHTS